MLKLGKYYKTLKHISVEEEVEHQDIPEPPREIIAPLEEDFPIKADQYQTSSTAFTEFYASEQPVPEVFKLEIKIEQQEMTAFWESWSLIVPKAMPVHMPSHVEQEVIIEETPSCLPHNNLEMTRETDVEVSMTETEPEIQVPEEVEEPVPESEDSEESSSEEQQPISFEKPSPAPARRSLKPQLNTSNWDEQAWIRAYRRMSSVMIFPRPPIEPQEHFTTVYEFDALRVLYNFPPVLGFFGVDYDDTWNRAARVIQRLFKKGYFLKLIAKVTRMNRELKKAEEITQNRKRRRLALKM